MRALDIYTVARRDELARQAIARSADLDLRESERRLYSLSRAIGALLNERATSGSFEAEVSEELGRTRQKHSANSLLVPLWALRDMSAAGASGSNYLVGTELRIDSLAELLRGRSVVATLPITSLPNCVGHVVIPRETAGPTAQVITDETTQITASQGTIGQVALTPRNVASLTNLSRQFAIQTGEGGARYVRSTLLKAIGAKLDQLAIAGSGTSGEPLGIASQITGSVSGTSLDEADVREFQTDVGDNLGPDFGFVTTQAVASLLNGRQRFTGSDRTLWEGNVHAGELGGWPAYSSPSVATGNLIGGGWNSVVLAEWGEAIEIALNPYASFNTGGIAVRAWATFDVGLMRPAAFSIAATVT